MKFAEMVADIAPSLQQLEVQSGPSGIFVHRLVFAVRYAEFHQRRMNNDIQGAALDLIALFTQDLVPKSWWAVVLCDSIDFLQFSTSFTMLHLLDADVNLALYRRDASVFFRRGLRLHAKIGRDPYPIQAGVRRRLLTYHQPDAAGGDESGAAPTEDGSSGTGGVFCAMRVGRCWG